ncbi:methyltransferase domain-containing protein [Pseudothermotoga sp.]|uniref:class I SAM-dependent methyltransferase n=1 Tax=Pseudothermotoga sp. TaxID=2033661 RepID=UPI0031F6E49B
MVEKNQPSLLDFLEGKAFSVGLHLQIPDQPYMTRFELLEKLLGNKTVIHIGFADHKDLILKKIENNTWLHKRLIEISQKCVGIDIDCETVEFVRKKLSIPNVFCLDIMEADLPIEILSAHWDCVLLGEIIEHVNNPVQFLTNLRKKFLGLVDSVIITTPNALRISNFEFALKGSEVINSDHRYWFTPYTLMKIATTAGYKIQNLYMVQSYHDQNHWYLVSKIAILRDDIVLVCNF